MSDKNNDKVVFRRIRGRIVPIRSKGGAPSPYASKKGDLSAGGIAGRQTAGGVIASAFLGPVAGFVIGNEWARAADKRKPERKAMYANTYALGTAGVFGGLAAGGAAGAAGFAFGKKVGGIATGVGAIAGAFAGSIYGQVKGYQRSRNVKKGHWFATK